MKSLTSHKLSMAANIFFATCLAFSAHGSANVFDDAVFWFRGGKDKNGDGYIQQGEFFDDLHADDESHSNHTMLMSSSQYYVQDDYADLRQLFKANAVFRSERVVFPALGTNVVAEMQTLHISDIGVPSGGSTWYLPFSVNPRSLFKNLCISNKYTVVSRIRLDDLEGTNFLFSIGYNDSAKQGMRLGFAKHPSYAQCKNVIAYCTKDSGSDNASYAINNMRIPTNTWVDVAVVVGNGSLRVGVATPTSYSENYPSIAFAEIGMWTDNCELLGRDESYCLFCPKNISAPSRADVDGFRGSVQQLAIWGRSLSDQEVMSAFGMPRPAIFRIGFDNDASNEFGGTRANSTQTLEGLGSWQSVWNTMRAGDILTVNFNALRDEAGLPQIFSIKSLPGSAAAQIEAKLNGTSLGEGRIAANARAFWPVAINLVNKGANTLVIERKDGGTRDFFIDAMELGGALGVGNASHTYEDGRVLPEQIATGVPSAADPNLSHWPLGFRPYYNNNTNLNFRMWVDPEVVGVCTSRFWTCVQCKRVTGTVRKTDHFTILVNQEAKTNVYANSEWVDVALDFNPGVLHGGWNDFEIRSAEAYQTLYWVFDRYRFETVLPSPFGFSTWPGMAVILR